MTERAAKNRRSRVGWLSLASVGAIVITAGFGVGIIVGISWEEPGLAISWLTGDTDGIEWRAADRQQSEVDAIVAADPEPMPDVAAAPLGASRTRGSTAPTKEPAAPATPPKPTTAVSSATGETFAVQVGAFAQRRGAEELAALLREHDFPVYVSSGERGARWRVRVGPLPSRERAEETAERLKRERKLPTWIQSEGS